MFIKKSIRESWDLCPGTVNPYPRNECRGALAEGPHTHGSFEPAPLRNRPSCHDRASLVLESMVQISCMYSNLLFVWSVCLNVNRFTTLCVYLSTFGPVLALPSLTSSGTRGRRGQVRIDRPPTGAPVAREEVRVRPSPRRDPDASSSSP